ncbi:MAG: HDOD domain-containing protein [Nitrospinae bacterium]|nr:HDOD domain-containing protein [Nitrospinota bacterium]
MSIKPSLENLVNDIDELPPLPAIAMKALHMAESEGSSALSLAEIIMADQALTASILRLCNSPYYGLAKKVDSAQHAIAMLGLKAVRNLVVSFAMQGTLKKGTDEYLMGPGGLWEAALTSAFLAGTIAELKAKPLKEVAFTAGIIHDIGKVICARYLGSYFEEIVALVKEKKINFNQAEKEVLGFDHQEIGGKIAEKWNFPADLVEAVRRHHNPSSAPVEHQKLVGIIHISDVVCLGMGAGLGVDGLHYSIDEKAMALLKIDERDMLLYSEYVLTAQDMVQQFVA